MLILMKIRIVFSLLAITILAINVSAQNSNQTRAAALWEEAIRAKGGRERLQTIQNVLIVSKIKVEAPRALETMEARKLYVLPDRAWLRASFPGFEGGLEVVIFSINRRICSVRIAPDAAKLPGRSPCVFPDWAAHVIQDPVTYLLETKWIQPTLIGTRFERTGSKQVDVIEVEVNRLRIDFYLDRETRLPFKSVIKKSDGTSHLAAHSEMTINFSDYISVEGIQMPRKITRESAARPSLVSRQIEHAEYSFNVEYDKSLFDQILPRSHAHLR